MYGITSSTIIGLISVSLAIIILIAGAFQLKKYIETSIKKGADDAANQAIENWKSVAESQKGRMEEMGNQVNELEKKIDVLTKQNETQKGQIDKLQKTIESMIGVDGVGKMVEAAIEHFNGRMDTVMSKQDTIIELLKAKDSKSVVNVNTK